MAAALAHLASRDGGAVLVDADVDAPNLGILLQPQIEATIPFTGGSRARVIAERCVGCGRCFDVCRFDAVTWRDGVYRIQTLSCEGCAACYSQCPDEAIAMDPCQAGEWYRSSTRLAPLRQLFPGQEFRKLVSTVRQQAIIAAAAAESLISSTARPESAPNP